MFVPHRLMLRWPVQTRTDSDPSRSGSSHSPSPRRCVLSTSAISMGSMLLRCIQMQRGQPGQQKNNSPGYEPIQGLDGMQPTMNRQQACLGRSAMAVREESVWKLLADTHETASHF